MSFQDNEIGSVPSMGGSASGGGGGPFGMGQGADIHANMVGRFVDNELMRRQSSKAYDRQKEFAQAGVQWRVKDAQAAGVHPLYALGANVSSYAPQSVFDPGFSQMGQDVSRAARATMTSEQRVDLEMRRALVGSQIQESDARRDLLYAQAARTRMESGPAFPSGGVPSSDPASYHAPLGSGIGHRDMVAVKPSETSSRSSRDASTEAAVPPFFKEYEFRPGFRAALPGKEAAEALEGVSESWPISLLMLLENERRQPGFIRKLLGAYMPGVPSGADVHRRLEGFRQRWSERFPLRR